MGIGQYGKVFKGLFKKDEGIGYPVAVKTIKEYESQKEKDNFLKEMNIMSKLIHPNIVRLFGLIKQGNAKKKISESHNTLQLVYRGTLDCARIST